MTKVAIKKSSKRITILEIESDALIEEYRSLRLEISQRVQNQFYIVGGSFALISAFLGVISKKPLIDNLTIVFLSPLVFFVIAWLYFEQDVFLTQAATYLHQKLRPMIIARIAEATEISPKDISLMEWESFRHDVLFTKRRNRFFLQIMTIFRLVATLGPGAAILFGVVYVVLMDPSHLINFGWLEYSLITIDIVGLCFLCYQYWHVLKLYKEIAL